MTVFVQISPDEYDAAAFAAFAASAQDFQLVNARALIWLSQLAYETHVTNTIPIVSRRWGFSTAQQFQGAFGTCGLIGERPDAVFLVFAGTDPGIWENIATDGQFRPDPNTGVHEGFQRAAEGAAARIASAAQLSVQTGKPLFIAGHSLGAALAALAAQAVTAQGAEPRAVYTYGMPRTGGAAFQQRYDPRLGAKTYRLVYGADIVARVPMSVLGYRHVGRVLMCNEGARFDAAGLSAVGSDDPAFVGGLPHLFHGAVANLTAGRVWSKPGPGVLGPLFRFLRPEIRDHLPDSYWTALTP
ncbi:MAG: lipase family protein [Pseudolabrys sp.]